MTLPLLLHLSVQVPVASHALQLQMPIHIALQRACPCCVSAEHLLCIGQELLAHNAGAAAIWIVT